MSYTLQACAPCNCTTYGSRSVYNVTAKAIQKWLSQANTAGKNHNVNPAIFLAFASIETNGDYSAIDTTGTTYGIVQVGKEMLSYYNSYKGTSYTLKDLIAKGSKVTTSTAAVALSFDILGQYLEKIFGQTKNSLLYSATGWNGAICGYSGSVKVFGSYGAYPIPTGYSCYGYAIYKLATAYTGWWPIGDAATYTAALSTVSTDTLATYNSACYGSK